MKTFSECDNISLLRRIVKNNTNKRVDLDTVQYNTNKIRFKTGERFHGISSNWDGCGWIILPCFSIFFLCMLLPVFIIAFSQTPIALLFGIVVDCVITYIVFRTIMNCENVFSILITFISAVVLVWMHLFIATCCGVSELNEFYNIPEWLYKFKF